MAVGTVASPPTGLSLSRPTPPRPRGGAPGQPVARQRRPERLHPLPAVPWVPGWSPAAPAPPSPSRRRARPSAPPGRGEAAGRGRVPAAAPPLSGSGRRARPAGAAPGRGAGGHQSRTSPRNDGDTLPGWPLFHCPFRHCRLLFWSGTLKPRVLLKRAEDWERTAVTLQLLSRPRSCFPQQALLFRVWSKGVPFLLSLQVKYLGTAFFCHSKINLLPAVTDLDEISVNCRRARGW